MTMPKPEPDWELPSRGRTAMYCLITAEAAIFTIFVVAYLFYLGKSLAGPMPKDVLAVPIFYTVCLLSSSLTIHLAVSALSFTGRRANGIG
jgi:cytochrome c oxidase subunit 3/cytochrome o ubiquinol oxidase subunit 3